MAEGQLEAMFQQMDVDGDGVLSLSDLSTALRTLGLEVDAGSLMEKLDSSGDGAITFDDFRHGVLEQGIFGDFSGGGSASGDSFDLDMSDDEDMMEEEGDANDLLQEICDNLRTDKGGRVSFTELERSISLCIGHLLAEDDRTMMIKAFKEIEQHDGQGVPLENVPAVLNEWMSGSGRGGGDTNGGRGPADGGLDMDMHLDIDDVNYAPSTPGGRQRKASFHGSGTSFFTDDGDEQSQIYHEMELEVTMLRKKLATTSQESLTFKHQLQAVQQNHHELDRREKESKLALARMQRKLKDAESNLARSEDEEASLRSTIAALQQTLKRKTSEVETLSETLKTWKAREADKRNRQADGAAPMTPKSSEIDSLRRELLREEQRRQALEDDIAALQDQLVQSKADHEMSITKYEKAKIALGHLDKRHSEQEKEIMELKETIATLNNDLDRRRRVSSTNDMQSFQVSEWIIQNGGTDRKARVGENGAATPMGAGLSPIGTDIDESTLGDGIDDGTDIKARHRGRFESDGGEMTSLALDLMGTDPEGNGDVDQLEAAADSGAEGSDGSGTTVQGLQRKVEESAKAVADAKASLEIAQQEIVAIRAEQEQQAAEFSKEKKRLEVERKMTARRTGRMHDDEKRKLAAQLQEEAEKRAAEAEEIHLAQLQSLRDEMQAEIQAARTADAPVDQSTESPSLEVSDSGVNYATLSSLKAELAEVTKAHATEASEATELSSRYEKLEQEMRSLAHAPDDAASEATSVAVAAALSAEKENNAITVQQLQDELQALRIGTAKDIDELQSELAAAQLEKEEAVAAAVAETASAPLPPSIDHIFKEVLMPWQADLKTDDQAACAAAGAGATDSGDDGPAPPVPSRLHKTPLKSARSAPSKSAGGANVEMDVKNVLRRMVASPSEFSTTNAGPFDPKNATGSAVGAGAGAVTANGTSLPPTGRRITGGPSTRSRRSKGKSRRKSNLYGMRDTVMPDNHKPGHEGGLQRFLQNKLTMAQRQRTILERRMAAEGNTRTTGQLLNIEMATHMESFASQACAQVSTFKGDYRSTSQNLSIRTKMKEKGMEPLEQIVFSTVLHRCVPAFLFFSTKKKRELIITTKAIYECDNTLTFSVRRRLAYRDINIVSISTAAADVFALLPRAHFDLLYQTMRRTEIVARLMQCYEAEVGTPLKIRFMQTILLTMENGDIKTTYVDEENATVKMEEYKPTTSANQGFICPTCKQKFTTAPKLQKHFDTKHANDQPLDPDEMV